jgi:hypothetical protein
MYTKPFQLQFAYRESMSWRIINFGINVTSLDPFLYSSFIEIANRSKYKYVIFMFVQCINNIKALLLFHNDAHNHKITGILKQLKIPTVAPTCFGSRRNHNQGAIFVIS